MRRTLTTAIVVCATSLACLAPSSAIAAPQLSSSADGPQANANSPAETEPLQLSEAEQAELVGIMSARGISLSDQQQLLTKISSGKLVDADNPEALPIREDEIEANGKLVRTLTFQDGSVAIATSESSSPEISPRASGISQCRSYNYNSGWVRHDNCLVMYDGISFKYSFRASYSTTRHGGVNALIRSVSNPYVWRSVGHVVSNKYVSIINRSQNGTSPARAQMVAEFQVLKVFSTVSLDLNLYVRDGRAWVSY